MPPLRLDHVYPPRIRLKIGDVVMVHRQLLDKQTKRPFTWKWLGVVKQPLRNGAVVIRFGGPDGKDEVTIYFHSVDEDDEGIWLIPEEEWPDGAHAFRVRLILEGRLDDAVLG